MRRGLCTGGEGKRGVFPEDVFHGVAIHEQFLAAERGRRVSRPVGRDVDQDQLAVARAREDAGAVGTTRSFLSTPGAGSVNPGSAFLLPASCAKREVSASHHRISAAHHMVAVGEVVRTLGDGEVKAASQPCTREEGVLEQLCASVGGVERRAKGLLAFEEVRERVGDIGTPGRTLQVAIGCPCHHYPTRLHRWRTSAHLCTWCQSSGPVHPHPRCECCVFIKLFFLLLLLFMYCFHI